MEESGWVGGVHHIGCTPAWGDCLPYTSDFWVLETLGLLYIWIIYRVLEFLRRVLYILDIDFLP